ncbi:MAG: TerB family tellurite resistance protein [bacterium]|nr:TerB family tellurite resistance protein [bacterium]
MKLTKESLHHIVFAAFIMAAVDGYMDDDEISVIQNFTTSHWTPEMGDQNEFFRLIDQQVVAFFAPLPLDGLTRDHADGFFEKVLPQLERAEREALVGLMTEVMQADQILETEELELLDRLKAAL